MVKEAEDAGDALLDGFKQQVFASAFGSWNPKASIEAYQKMFDVPKEPNDEDYEEFVPENAEEVAMMMNRLRRSGVLKD